MRTVKASKGLPMEGMIATWYARNTGRDVRRFTDTARLVAGRVRPGGDVLEVAPGPGYLAIEMAKRGYSVTALDISKTFVRIARENAARNGVSVDVRQGNAQRRCPLPMRSSTSSCVWRPSRTSPTRSAPSMRCTEC